MTESIPDLTTQELRKFGFVTGAILVVLFSLVFPWLFDKGLQLWPLYIATPLWFLALVLPAWLEPVYSGWMKTGSVLGWINSRIILGIVFYLLIFPIGILLSIFGKDPMKRHFEPKTNSYRVVKGKRQKIHVERPF